MSTHERALVVSRPLGLDKRPALVYAAGLAKSSRRVVMQALEEMAEILAGADAANLNWGAVRFQHAAAIRERLLENGNSPATVNRKLSALRGVLKAAWLLGQMTAEDYQRAAAVESVRGERLPAGRALTSGELKALMGACDPRDAAVIGLMYGGGLRRGEVVALDLEDYNRETGELRVRGKGNKERLVHVAGGARRALEDWLTLRGEEGGPLFVPVNKGGAVGEGRLTTQAIYTMLERRAGEAGIAAVRPHDLRRSFVGDLLDAGADIATVARMAGHSQISTTARYDRRGEETKRRAAKMLHVPYKG